MSEPVYPLQIRFPASLKLALESYAAQTGMSQNHVVVEAVRRYLAAAAKKEAQQR